jgi:GT2 family glycosyltransferase
VKLSIIIVNYRSWDSLERCLQSLVADGRHQVIVVDNASGDGKLTQVASRYPMVEFHESPVNGGFAHGCNQGAGKARGELLLFMNPDVLAEPAQVEALAEFRRAHPTYAICSARQVDANGRLQKAFDVFPDLLTWFKSVKSLLRLLRPSRFPNPYRELSGPVECDWVSGSIFLIGRAEFEQLGGWCESYWMYMEDCDLCFQARSQGLKVAYTPHVSFVHLHGGASRQTPEVTVRTKTETVISKHVFIDRHSRGFRNPANHLIVAVKSLVPLAVYSLLDLLTLHLVSPLKTRSRMFLGLLGYYRGSPGSRQWRSRNSVVS